MEGKRDLKNQITEEGSATDFGFVQFLKIRFNCRGLTLCRKVRMQHTVSAVTPAGFCFC